MRRAIAPPCCPAAAFLRRASRGAKEKAPSVRAKGPLEVRFRVMSPPTLTATARVGRGRRVSSMMGDSCASSRPFWTRDPKSIRIPSRRLASRGGFSLRRAIGTAIIPIASWFSSNLATLRPQETPRVSARRSFHRCRRACRCGTSGSGRTASGRDRRSVLDRIARVTARRTPLVRDQVGRLLAVRRLATARANLFDFGARSTRRDPQRHELAQGQEASDQS